MEDVLQASWITLTKLEEARFLDSVAEIRVWKLVDLVLGLAALGVALARHNAVAGPAGVTLLTPAGSSGASA